MGKKSFQVEVISQLCKGCGLCVSLCPTGVLAKSAEGKAMVADETKCIGCQNCVLHCPDFCVEVTEKEA